MQSIPLRLWLFAGLSALLQVLSFPTGGPIPLWRTAFSWVALTPLLFALQARDRENRPLSLMQGAALGYSCGILWYLGNCYWIYQTMYRYGGLDKPVSVGILLLFCLYLGLYHAIFAIAIGWLRRGSSQLALTLVPFVWVTVELARARVTGFPWDLLGNTQIDNALLLRLAPYTGVYGLSFLVAAVNALWLLRIKVRERRGLRPALAIGAVIFLLLYGGAVRRSQLPPLLSAGERATLVQENLGVGTEAQGNQETESEMLASFAKLSLHPPADRCLGIPELASTRCLHFIGAGASSVSTNTQSTLIVWPESPSGFVTENPAFASRMSQLAVEAKAPLVIGSIGISPDARQPRALRKYDSAALFTADGEFKGRYDKIHLVPWGEYIPFKDLFFFANKLTAGVGDMDRGTERKVFHAGGHGYGVFICYESIFGDEVRQFVENGAEVLVNISDDGWYGDTSAAWEHLNMVRMRAVENHRWIVRSTNTGVTAAIDPYGRVTAAAPRHIRTALQAGFNFERAVTFYTRHGDLFAYFCTLVTVAAAGYCLSRRDALN